MAGLGARIEEVPVDLDAREARRREQDQADPDPAAVHAADGGAAAERLKAAA